MTINELNDLIARGAAQPGVHEVQEMMRLGHMLDEQARELATLFASPSSSPMSCAGTESPSTADITNAHLG